MNLDYNKISHGDLCDIADCLDSNAYDCLCEKKTEDEQDSRAELIELIEERKEHLSNVYFIKNEWLKDESDKKKVIKEMKIGIHLHKENGKCSYKISVGDKLIDADNNYVSIDHLLSNCLDSPELRRIVNTELND